jgi:hypothetical protein
MHRIESECTENLPLIGFLPLEAVPLIVHLSLIGATPYNLDVLVLGEIGV